MREILCWMLKLLKKVLFICFAKIVPFVANLSVMVIPFLSSIVKKETASLIWGIAFAVIIIDEVYQLKNRKKAADYPQMMDALTRGNTFLGGVLFGSILVIRYFETSYSWKWMIAVCVAAFSLISFENLRKAIEIRREYSPEQIKDSKRNTAKPIAFWLLADGFYVSILLGSTEWQFISGGLCFQANSRTANPLSGNICY